MANRPMDFIKKFQHFDLSIDRFDQSGKINSITFVLISTIDFERGVLLIKMTSEMKKRKGEGIRGKGKRSS